MISRQLLLDVKHHLFQGNALFVPSAGIEEASQVIEGSEARAGVRKIEMDVPNGNLARVAHLGQQLQKVQESQCLAGTGFTPNRQVTGVVITEDRREVAAELFDFRVSDAGVEDFVEDVQLL